MLGNEHQGRAVRLIFCDLFGVGRPTLIRRLCPRHTQRHKQIETHRETHTDTHTQFTAWPDTDFVLSVVLHQLFQAVKTLPESQPPLSWRSRHNCSVHIARQHDLHYHFTSATTVAQIRFTRGRPPRTSFEFSNASESVFPRKPNLFPPASMAGSASAVSRSAPHRDGLSWIATTYSRFVGRTATVP